MTFAPAVTAGRGLRPGKPRLVDGSVSYSEPGSATRREDPGSAQVSFTPNSLARLFARLINGVIWLGAGFLLLLGGLAIIGGIAISEIWPYLDGLLVSDLPNADDAIEEALTAKFARYRVRDVALVALIPVAAVALWLFLRVMYFCLMVRFAGGDLGHLAMGMRVVNYRNGGRPSFGQALGRAVLKQLDLLVIPWVLNGVMATLARERRHSYDLIANTIVVAEGWMALPFLEPKPAYLGVEDPQLNENWAIPLPPFRD